MQYQDVSGSTPMEQSQFACENVVASLALYQQIKDTASLSDDKTSVKAAQDLMLVVYCQLMPARQTLLLAPGESRAARATNTQSQRRRALIPARVPALAGGANVNTSRISRRR